ncbi:MAG: hypothetical protein RLZZ301_28 [Bacteroidota bacterium]|jgi:F-type H+-transporting ATPase subunit delta
MKSSKSAARYAKALLELALDQNKVEVIESNVAQLIALSAEAHDFHVFLNSPLIQIDKKIAVIQSIFKDFDPSTLSFLELVTTNGREAAMIEIAQQFMAQLKAHRGIVPVTLISATQLDETTKKDIVAKIQKAINGTLELTEEIDANLIGGFIVRMGDQQIDASVANQLKRMKQQFV